MKKKRRRRIPFPVSHIDARTTMHPHEIQSRSQFPSFKSKLVVEKKKKKKKEKKMNSTLSKEKREGGSCFFPPFLLSPF